MCKQHRLPFGLTYGEGSDTVREAGLGPQPPHWTPLKSPRFCLQGEKDGLQWHGDNVKDRIPYENEDEIEA